MVETTDATSVTELVQTPPAVLLLKVVEAPLQTSIEPVMAATVGKALMVIPTELLYAVVHAPFVTAAR